VARKNYNKQIAKVVAGLVLLGVAVIGLEYGSLLGEMSEAAQDYNHGDAAAALKRYEDVEQRLRSYGAIRLIPSEDRRNLFLDEARVLYSQGRYDDALERLNLENQISGTTTDSRFFLLRGDITFRKAIQTSREPGGDDDPHAVAESISPAEEDFRESLRADPNDWDAKYNLEYVNYIRLTLEKDREEGMKVLPQMPTQDTSQQNLTPKQKM
jgi:tetratricopeptide (TPR) repeat protein